MRNFDVGQCGVHRVAVDGGGIECLTEPLQAVFVFGVFRVGDRFQEA
jgi:hypothetical protein